MHMNDLDIFGGATRVTVLCLRLNYNYKRISMTYMQKTLLKSVSKLILQQTP
jgi:hypothetical protein